MASYDMTSTTLSQDEKDESNGIKRKFAGAPNPDTPDAIHPNLALARSLGPNGLPRTDQFGPVSAPLAPPSAPTSTPPSLGANGLPQTTQSGPVGSVTTPSATGVTTPVSTRSAYDYGAATRSAIGGGLYDAARLNEAAGSALTAPWRSVIGPVSRFGAGLFGADQGTTATATPAAPAPTRPVAVQPSGIPGTPSGPVMDQPPAPYTRLPPVSYGPYAAHTDAPAWTGGGATPGRGNVDLPAGIFRINGPDGVPIFTNNPVSTSQELVKNGKLAMNADQSLTFPGVSNLVGNGSGGYTGGTIGVPNTGLTRSIGQSGYDPMAEFHNAQADRQQQERFNASDVLSLLSGDPRSPWGALGRKLDIDYPSFIPGGRRGTAGEGPGQAMKSELVRQLFGQTGGSDVGAGAALSRAQLGEQGEDRRALMHAAAEEQKDELAARGIGTNDNDEYGVYDRRTGKWTPMLDNQGKPVKKPSDNKLDTKTIGSMLSGGQVDPNKLTNEARKTLGFPAKPALSEFITEAAKVNKGMTSDQLRQKYREIYGE